MRRDTGTDYPLATSDPNTLRLGATRLPLLSLRRRAMTASS